MLPEEDTSGYIEKAVPWKDLPENIKACFGKEIQYYQRIKEYYYDHQKKYTDSLKNYIQPKEYYSELIDYGINNFLVFPYHLIKELRLIQNNNFVVTPFTYYIDMLVKVMSSEKSYQSIPNFSAADAKRVTGVGRNEFIDCTNTSHVSSFVSLFQKKENQLRDILPKSPAKIDLCGWWKLYTLPANASKLQKLSGSSPAYTKIASEDGSEIRNYQEADIRNLLNENLLYIEVPLDQNDIIKILPPDPEKFVMNKLGGDYLESLCYKTFILVDQRTTVDELSSLLSVDVSEVTRVLSLFVRLGFAEKITANENIEDNNTPSKKSVACIYDCNLPGALMISNLGQKVLDISVAMYEVGRLADKSLDDFIESLKDIKEPDDDTMLKCYKKCQTIAQISSFLKENVSDISGVEFLHLESILKLDNASISSLFQRNYKMIISLSPLTLKQTSISLPDFVHFGPPSELFHSPWVILYLSSICKTCPPIFVWPQGDIVTTLPCEFYEYKTVRLFEWGKDPEIVQTATLLISLNDALPSSPVLVQCYERQNYDFVEITFPFDEGFDELSNNFATNTMFGVIKCMKSETEMIPIDIIYGIPISELELCQTILEKVKQRKLFDEENISKMKSETQRISNDLLEFVNKWSLNNMTPVAPLTSIDGEIKMLK